MIKLGSHVSFKAPDYLVGAIKESLKNKANCTMIYLGPPQNSRRVGVEKYKFNEYKKEFSTLIKPEDIVVHAPYIINLASVEKHQFAIDFLIEEIQRMNYIGAKYLVVHPGSFTKFPHKMALNTFVRSIKTILSKTKNVIICAETMAGKGTEISINFDELRYFIDEIDNERFKICLDTCHVWDAGYNIKNYEEFKEELKKYNLLKEIKVIHLNDSKNDINSKKDRHENIGKGFIGLPILAKFVHDKDFENIPIILETPLINGESIYDKEIKILREFKK